MSQTIPDLGDEPLSITQLCERLDASRPTIYRYMAMTDPLPSSRPSPINRHRRMFDPREVEAWLARNRCSDPAADQADTPGARMARALERTADDAIEQLNRAASKSVA
jgi:predicted DNA-binding transcriptional regulator AlpA